MRKLCPVLKQIYRLFCCGLSHRFQGQTPCNNGSDNFFMKVRVPKLNVSCSIITLCMKNSYNSLSGTSLKFPYGHPLQILQFSIMDISNCTSETKVITPSMSTHSPSIFALSLFLPSKTIYPDLSELIIISTSAYPSLREKKKGGLTF